MKTLNIFRSMFIVTTAALVVSCTTPDKIEVIPDNIVLEGPGASKKLEAKVFDKDGKQITEGTEVVWFSEDTKIIKLSHDGEVTGIASGEAKVEVELVGTKLKTEASIRVKIPASINVSHEKLRLWTGQVKDNVWAEVHSEKGAFIEGYMPEWHSEDPTIVKVEQIKDPPRRQSWVRLTGIKSGLTHINASFQAIAKRIRVSVYDEDEEVALDGRRIPKEKDENKDENKEEEEKDKKKSKKKKKKKKK
ncbi:MAG: hypothetical protein GY847_30115 [Proteobacteria bacterium]|nr:hypothetical protein [Pseudomonadota bacterium]